MFDLDEFAAAEHVVDAPEHSDVDCSDSKWSFVCLADSTVLQLLWLALVLSSVAGDAAVAVADVAAAAVVDSSRYGYNVAVTDAAIADEVETEAEVVRDVDVVAQQVEHDSESAAANVAGAVDVVAAVVAVVVAPANSTLQLLSSSSFAVDSAMLSAVFAQPRY